MKLSALLLPALLGILMSSFAVAAPTPENLLRESLDPDVFLWSVGHPGHTKPVVQLPTVHSGVASSSRLVIAAQLGMLDALPVDSILQAIRDLQCVDGSWLHGCFRWYREEPKPVDINAAFFTGLNLIALSANYRDQLSERGRTTLDAMLKDMQIWFESRCEERTFFYPNRFLGDVVCGWLLYEQIGDESARGRLLPIMSSAADYWLGEHWGWGEHMSDGYSRVMLDELSALLLFSKKLPADVREKYQRMFTELASLENRFEGLRVPAIRTYAFAHRPPAILYRDGIRNWSSAGTLSEGDPRLNLDKAFHLGHLFNELGWHRLEGERPEPGGWIEVPCFGGAVARAWVTPGARMGTMSRYPIMPETEHPTWGMSWQSMPVALAAGSDGWGFLRWHTREGGVDRFHPAHKDKRSAYLRNALTDVVVPPIVGLTDSLQEAGDACVLRRMPALSRSWETLADQFVLLGSAFTVVEEEIGADVSRLLVRAEGQPVTIFFFSLGSGVRPRLREEPGEIVWEAVWSPEILESQERAAGVWMIAWGRDVPCPKPPTPAPVGAAGHRTRLQNDGAWLLDWPLEQGIVRIAVDPLDEDVLQRLQ